MPRFAIRDWTKTVKFNGSSSYLVKTSPTGLNTGTDARYWMGWVRLQSTALACLFQFRVNGFQSPAGIIGLLTGTYYLFADTINAGNNLTITAAEYRKWFPTGVPIHVVYEITNTTLYVTVNGVLFKTVSFGTAINTAAYDSIAQGRLVDSGGSPQYHLNGFQKDCVWGNGRLSTADIEAHRLRGEVPSSAVSHFYMEDESDSSLVADGKGSNSMTINATSFFPEPSSCPRQSLNENMLKNPEMKQSPYFVAATNTPDRSIDGTVGGGPLGYSPYTWKLAATSVYAGGTGYSARFDRIAGLPCIRIVSVGKIWKSGGTVTQMVIGHTAYTGPSLTAIDRSNLVPVKPNTLYNCSLDYWNTQLDAGITPSLTIVAYNASLNRIDTSTSNGATDVSTAWRTLTRAYTTPASAAYIAVIGRVAAGGSSDFDTGNCDVAFTRFVLNPGTLFSRSTVSVGQRQLTPASSPLVQATASIQVLDYNLLDGVSSSASMEVTDYTLMSGGSFDLLSGMLTLTEGVDFDAETSNEVTANNLANAINTAVEETVATVVGAVMTLAVPSENEGGVMEWIGSGVTPSSAILSGGEPRLRLEVWGSNVTFGGDGGIDVGLSNSDAATAIAAWVNTTIGVFAVADGDTVNLEIDPVHASGSAGNGLPLAIEDADSNPVDLTGIAVLSGSTFQGGSDLVVGRQQVS